MKPGKRLKQIEAMVTSQYDHIWDCCCDHGLSGAALLAKHAAPFIHFVDVVPALMHELENKLMRFFPENSNASSRWKMHCMDVSTLSLETYEGKHLIIIAGVGGDLMGELVKAIYQRNPYTDMDFLLCPVHHEFSLRQQLIELNLVLQNESLVEENNRFYEIIWVSNNKPGSRLNPIGDLIWQCDNQQAFATASNYLEKTIAHYQRKQLKDDVNVQPVVDAYKTIIIKEPVN